MDRTDQRCNICGAEVKLIEAKCPGYQESYSYEIYTCYNCNTSFSFPYIGADTIYDAIYLNAVDIKGYSRYLRYASEVKTSLNSFNYLKNSEETYFASLSIIEKIFDDKPSLKILEMGCGLGYFTYSLRKMGLDCIGLDISEKAIKYAIENFGNYYICENVETYSLKNLRQFDVIVANQLIEHIEIPLEFTVVLKEMLKPNGIIIYTTPNKSIYPIDAVWKTTDLPPVHCFWLSENSFIAMGKKLKMDVSFFDFSKWYKNSPKFIGYSNKNTLAKCKPVIDKGGKAIIMSDSVGNIDAYKRKLLIGILLNNLKKVRGSRTFIKWKYRLLGYYYRCSDKGDVLCAILKK